MGVVAPSIVTSWAGLTCIMSEGAFRSIRTDVRKIAPWTDK
jgi:hypothetical protein